ncbi:hypothetical protein K438DRAFT_1930652 [Mycena galopus ATCC 62051]|nr:hypothetical protein K438DRAFT_1930652 [Mycena galopus ATCC 62051]
MAGTYHWVVLLVFFFPLGTLASFIVDDFTKPALTCTPFLIQWQGGISPWTLRVLEASNPNVLENLGTLKVTSFNWNVDLAAGTSVQIQLQDSSGAIALSQTLTIQAGCKFVYYINEQVFLIQLATDCTLSTAEIQQPTTQQTTTQQSTIQQSTTKLSVTQLTATKQATSSSAIASTSSTAVPQTFSLTRSFISSAYTTLSTTESRSVAPEQSPVRHWWYFRHLQAFYPHPQALQQEAAAPPNQWEHSRRPPQKRWAHSRDRLQQPASFWESCFPDSC